MCGLAGFFGGAHSAPDRVEMVERMKKALAHRGPDGEGLYSDPDGHPLVLGHRRLAIIDPERGGQPMTTSDGMVTVVFNGAIYNYLELRRELISKGHAIASYSDTEVILHSYTEWGEECVDKFNGMFAFAIWDRRKKSLFCARDRVGIKPFYYHVSGGRLIFASEIKAILATGVVTPESDSSAIEDYITFQFYLDGKTLFKNIRELSPGHILTARMEDGGAKVGTRKYWDARYDIDAYHTEEYFVDRLAYLLEDSVRLQLRSDVPLGAHLSGGLDSSCVVSFASAMLEGMSFKTFTGAFSEGPQFDETHYAKKMAEYAKSEYHEVYISGADFPEILPKLVYFMDQPSAGPGIYPQYFVSKLASQHVKVVLGGQGGDELFIGYARYLVAYLERCLYGSIFETQDKLKYAVSLESIIPNLPTLQNYLPMMRGFWKDGLFESDDKRYYRLIDRSDGMRDLFSPDVFAGGYSCFESYQKVFNAEGLHSLINRITYFDFKSSLPALLQVEDRTSMSVSLESRVPLLDHRVVELLASVPPNIKFAGGRLKNLFKQAIRNRLPHDVLERKDKMGFPVPLIQWANGQSRDFVHDILLSPRTRQRGVFNPAKVEQALKKESQFGRVVWGLLCLELWHRIFVDGEKPI